MVSLMRKSRLDAKGPNALHGEMRCGEIRDEKERRLSGWTSRWDGVAGDKVTELN